MRKYRFQIVIIVFINFIFGCTSASKFEGKIKETSPGHCIYEYINGDKLSGSCDKDENKNYKWKDGKERIYIDESGKIIGKYSSTLKAIVLYSEKGDKPLYCISGDCWNGSGKIEIHLDRGDYAYNKDFFWNNRFIFEGNFKEGDITIGNLMLKDSNQILYKLDNKKITPTKAGKLAENRYEKQMVKEEREYERENKQSEDSNNNNFKNDSSFCKTFQETYSSDSQCQSSCDRDYNDNSVHYSKCVGYCRECFRK